MSEVITGDKYWRMPGKHYREDRFWKKGGLYRNFKRGIEISNSFGLAIKVSDYEDRTLNIQILWPSIYIKLGPAPANNSAGFGPSWGFSLFDQSLHLDWGEKGKIIDPPWGLTHLRTEVLMQDGLWQQGWRDVEGQWKATQVPFFYQSRSCARQEGTAEITVRRMIHRGKLLPFRRKYSTHIDVQFDCEVGNQRGSWKGGVIGCCNDLKSGESPIECFNRMMREETFDR